MKSTSSALAAAAAISFGIAGCATHDEHAGHARLGKVSFPVECNAAAQREFNVAMAYYHSFAWQHIREPLEAVLKDDPSCGMAHWARALASLDNPFTWPGTISVATLNQGPDILETARKTGLKSQRERDYVDALAVFFRDHDKLDHRTRAKALENALERSDEALSAGQRSGDPLCAGAVGQLRSHGPQVHQPAQGRGGARADLQAAARASRGGALPHPQLRLPADRQAGPGRRAALRQDRAGRAARAPHAVAHLHAGGGVEGVGALQPRVGQLRDRQDLRQVARLRLHGVRAPAARRGRRRAQGRRGGARQSGARRSFRHGVRLCRDACAHGARARGLEGRGEGGARSRRGLIPGPSTRSPSRSTPTRAASAPR